MDVEELVKDLRRSVAEQAEKLAEQEAKLAKDKDFLAELEARLQSLANAPTQTPPASDSTGKTPAASAPNPAIPWPRNGVLTKVGRR